MAGITGLSTTFNLPNYPGELFGLTPEDTPFLAMAGGLTGGEMAMATLFGWQTYDLRDASQNTVVEGNTAPTAEGRVRAWVYNVVEIHHETISTSYTKQAAVGQLGGTGSAHPYGELEGMNRVRDEHSWQVAQMLKQIARDVEYSFLRGTFVEPATNATARQTRGILEAITTNATDYSLNATNVTGEDADDLIDAVAHPFDNNDQVMFTALTGGSGLSTDIAYFVVNDAANTFQIALTLGGTPVSFGTDITATSTVVELTEPTAARILQLMQDVWDNGGIQESETRTVFVNSSLRRYFSKLFITDQNYREMTRNVGGVSVVRVITDFGDLNIVLDRFMPVDTILVASMEQVAPVFLLHPEKGFLYREPLSKTGLSDEEQIAGEIGLKYGVEKAHGKITGLHGKYNPTP